jgi:predicted nucleic acid-binding protein
MGQLTPLITGRAVAFDTAPLIYYLEEHPTYLVLVDELFDAIDAGNATGMTSVLTLLEVLVKPLRDGQSQIADEYRQLLTSSSNLKLLAIDEAVSQRAASLRASHAWLRTPDALQLATAIEHGADVIVTNDERWKALNEIGVIVLKDYVTVS